MYIEYYGNDGRIRSLGDNELAHFNHNHGPDGRFARGNGVSSYDSRLARVNKKMTKTDKKIQSLRKKEANYKVKAAKYERKAVKKKAKGNNPLVKYTDFRESHNYKVNRLESKGAAYTLKAAKANKKITKLDKKYTKLGKERVNILAEKHTYLKNAKPINTDLGYKQREIERNYSNGLYSKSEYNNLKKKYKF